MEDKINTNGVEASLEGVDDAKRETLRKIVRGTAYAIPVVASFAIDGLTVSPALAIPSNSS